MSPLRWTTKSLRNLAEGLTRQGHSVSAPTVGRQEQLGQLPNPGRQWRPVGDPVRGEDHSFYFIGPDVEVAIPFQHSDGRDGGRWREG